MLNNFPVKTCHRTSHPRLCVKVFHEKPALIQSCVTPSDMRRELLSSKGCQKRYPRNMLGTRLTCIFFSLEDEPSETCRGLPRNRFGVRLSFLSRIVPILDNLFRSLQEFTDSNSHGENEKLCIKTQFLRCETIRNRAFYDLTHGLPHTITHSRRRICMSRVEEVRG